MAEVDPRDERIAQYVRDGTLAREHFEERMRGVERRVGQLLRKAARRAEKKTAGMAREILQWEKCLWTFVDVPGLEPTNNFGERCIRHAVMYRKTSFGTQSVEGSRFAPLRLTGAADRWNPLDQPPGPVLARR